MLFDLENKKVLIVAWSELAGDGMCPQLWYVPSIMICAINKNDICTKI